MGIPRLKRTLEPHAERTKISGRQAVIDGPSFAYFVYFLLKGNSKFTPLEQPSNEVLGQKALEWLDQIQACGLTVSAIYFDGFLPQIKRQERVKRLLGLSWDLRTYYDQCPAGIPKQRTAPWTSSTGGRPTKSPPPPPFLVPAIIEALKNSPKYSPITKVKPGEADVFCALNASLNGHVVLTSDSDLLAHELGSDGGVIFFSDMEIDMGSKSLSVLLFQPAAICEDLRIKLPNGLPRLAFELSWDHHITLEQAVKKTKSESTILEYPKEYSKFMEQYTLAETVSHADVEDDIDMDPRVAELALQCLFTSTAEVAQSCDIAMYLPFLLDSPLRTSAWEASRSTRQLAYGILLSGRDMPQQKPVPSVSEYRRLQVQSSGIRVDVPKSASALDQEAVNLLDALREITKTVAKTSAAWMILSVYQDIMSAIYQGKTRPLSLDLLFQDARGTLDQHSWDCMHFLAQVQATYYSLRMVQQATSFRQRQSVILSDTITQLGDTLSTLPDLSGFPAAGGFVGLLHSVKEADGLAVLARLFSEYSGIVEQLEQIQKPREETKQGASQAKKSRKRKNGSSGGGDTNRAASRNPFAVLEADE